MATCMSPVSSCSIVQCCVLPILLYGVGSWIMSCKSIKKLECFQGEIAKRVLQMPHWYTSSKVACIALGWNSIHSVCTIRKLRFLYRVKTNEKSICYRTYSAMADDVEVLSLVRECRELEERYRSDLDFTTQILEPTDHQILMVLVYFNREAEKYIVQKDQMLLPEVSNWKYQHIQKNH